MRPDQLFHMFHTPLRRSIRETGNTVLFQRHPFDFQQKFFAAAVLTIKIDARITISILSAQFHKLIHPGKFQMSVLQSFRRHFIRCLRIHIDQDVLLFHRDQRILQLTASHSPFKVFYVYHCSGNKKFPAPARILHMRLDDRSAQLHMGDKAVRSF